MNFSNHCLFIYLSCIKIFISIIHSRIFNRQKSNRYFEKRHLLLTVFVSLKHKGMQIINQKENANLVTFKNLQ